jgi:hypothetical protein
MTEALWQLVAQIVLAHVFSKEIKKFGVEIVETLRAVPGERNDPKFAQARTIR